MKCLTCDGCGRVANDDDRTPWSAWGNLPLKSAAAVLLGLVRPETCPDCRGHGRVLQWFGDSPDAGPDCECSWCGEAIMPVADPEDLDFEGFGPVRMWDPTDREMRFHTACLAVVRALGLLTEVEREEYEEPGDVMPAADQIDLGPCCACGRAGKTVRNLVCLPFRSPVPGTGWGCLVCGLAQDGAMAVVCDKCATNNVSINYVIKGMATDHGRMAIGDVDREPFQHRRQYHPELTGRLN